MVNTRAYTLDYSNSTRKFLKMTIKFYRAHFGIIEVPVEVMILHLQRYQMKKVIHGNIV